MMMVKTLVAISLCFVAIRGHAAESFPSELHGAWLIEKAYVKSTNGTEVLNPNDPDLLVMLSDRAYVLNDHISDNGRMGLLPPTFVALEPSSDVKETAKPNVGSVAKKSNLGLRIELIQEVESRRLKARIEFASGEIEFLSLSRPNQVLARKYVSSLYRQSRYATGFKAEEISDETPYDRMNCDLTEWLENTDSGKQ